LPQLRVLLVCDWFLKDTAHLAPELKKLGAEVALLCTRRAEEFADFDERARALDPVRAADIPVIELDPSMRKLAPQLQALMSSRRVARWRPDVVFAHDNRDPRLLLMTRAWPTVINVHDPVPHPGEKAPTWYRRPVSAAWTRRATVVTVHGEALKEELLRRMPAMRVATVPLGIVPHAEPNPLPLSPAVLFFGRLHEYKGIDILLAAMPLVWKARPDVRLIIAGGGPLESLIPTDPRVTARLGYIPEADIDGVFSQATLLVLPYRQASQSGPGGRALERGIPVIATSVGALPELVRDPEALVPPNDPNALARAIIGKLDHDDRTRQNLLDDAERRMSWRASAARLLDIFAAESNHQT
jgi:glycosyltransferase involved in cell wall biosynthesis